jgi:hypothetical protein
MYDCAWLLLVAHGSTKTIAGHLDLAKTLVLRHQQRHINDKVQNARMVKSTGFAGLLKAVTKLARRMEKHLVDGGRSETWFRESAKLRHWISLRSKLAGKLSIGDGEKVAAGDTYNLVCRGEEGQPSRIPLAVYEALPKEHLVINQNAQLTLFPRLASISRSDHLDPHLLPCPVVENYIQTARVGGRYCYRWR